MSFEQKHNQRKPYIKLIERAESGKESIGIQVADTIVLSRSTIAISYNNNFCINYQPMNYKEKHKNKHVLSLESPVGLYFGGKILTDDIEEINREKWVKYYSEPTKFGYSKIDENCGKFATIGGGVRTSDLNFPNVSKTTREVAFF